MTPKYVLYVEIHTSIRFQFILHVNLLLLKALFNLWDCRIVAVAVALAIICG